MTDVEHVVVPYTSLELNTRTAGIEILPTCGDGQVPLALTANVILKTDPEGVELDKLIGDLQAVKHQLQRSSVHLAIREVEDGLTLGLQR